MILCPNVITDAINVAQSLQGGNKLTPPMYRTKENGSVIPLNDLFITQMQKHQMQKTSM